MIVDHDTQTLEVETSFFLFFSSHVRRRTLKHISEGAELSS